MVEAREKVDQFDANIPSEGVIVYRVQTPDPLGHAQPNVAPLLLLTTTALGVGQTFTVDAHIKIKVIKAIAGGGGVNLFNSMGNPWTADYLKITGELDVDLRSNIAAEARAKIV